MCLILVALGNHPDYPLVLAANRDEFYDRPTATADFWEDAPEVLGGRDLEAGGTWLGITRTGRWAAVTNFRDPPQKSAAGASRGYLVSDYLKGTGTPGEYMEKIHERRKSYRGFNLLAGTAHEAWYFSNKGGEVRKLQAGIYGLSNHFLDTPWPKVVSGREALASELERAKPDPWKLFTLLGDRAVVPDHLLPETGVGLEWERLLSSRFIASPRYGTRASTVLMIDQSGKALFLERNFFPGRKEGAEVRVEFQIEGAAGREVLSRSDG